MAALERFFVLNPAIEEYKKIYIFGIDKAATDIFQELCTRRIYIDGFIDDQNAGMLYFHKPVYAIEELDSYKEDSILLCTDVNNELKDYHICTQICVLNPKLYEKNIIIYGAGIVGKKVFSILQNHEIEVIGFIDSDESKVGTSLLGKIVYGKEILQTLTNDTVIVECGRRYYEIDNVVKSMCGHLMCFYLDDEMPFELKNIWVDKEHHCQVGRLGISQLGEYCAHEQINEIILYGNNLQLARKYAEVLKCLDFPEVSFMTDCDGENDGIPLIDEIIYRVNYLLLWYEENDDYIINRLNELGVERRYYGKIICEYQWCMPNLNTSIACLDVNLGYTYETNCEYPGIYIYGENQKNDYRIAVLGGSTTDSTFGQDICPWVEIMYKQYCNRNVTIFNGAVSGYSSAQELFKLIRDILKLHPNMVIVYDGYNDLVKQGASSFAYLESLVSFAGKHMPRAWQMYFGEKSVWSGIPFSGSPMDDWLENIKHMFALSKSNNIDFFAFIQPMLYTKKNLDSHSKTILYQTPLFYKENFMKSAWQFREKAAVIEERYGYIHDLTYIFDDVDVYIDMAHVYEAGNRIIAKHIWDVIKDSVK